MSKPLDCMSVLTLEVRNLVVNEKGKRVPITMRRWVVCRKEDKVLKGVPTDEENHDFNNPFPGKYGLSIRVAEELGEGATGVTFATSHERLTDLTNFRRVKDAIPKYLPQLALKVTDIDCNEFGDNEALFYNLLQKLHGVAIPRFYGWFHMVLAPGMQIRQIDTGDVNKKRTIKMILLERLGDPITLKEDIDQIQDIDKVLLDISRFKVYHGDVRMENILAVPKSPPGMPGVICPWHNCEHKFRFIDLGLAGQKDYLGHSLVASLNGMDIESLYPHYRRVIVDSDNDDNSD